MRFGIGAAGAREMALDDGAKAHAREIVLLEQTERQRQFLFPGLTRGGEIALGLRREAKPFQGDSERMSGGAVVSRLIQEFQSESGAFAERGAGCGVVAGRERRIAVFDQGRGEPARVARIVRGAG